jgi:hypothetical protein
MGMIRGVFFLLCIVSGFACQSQNLLIPMDDRQGNHLKAYGVVYFLLQHGETVEWLLNYRGGSFLVTRSVLADSECALRGVSAEPVSDPATAALRAAIESPSANMNIAKLEKAARIVVYTPRSELISDESDAVIAVLDYAQIPYHILYDKEILRDSLTRYDWLHLHHEDFTGQHGRNLRRESDVMESKLQEITAQQFGYNKVSQMKLAVAKKIKAFCGAGGYLFAMCSAAETLDVALAADGVDISDSQYDGDEPDPDAQNKLDFSKTLAFENFTLEPGNSRRFSDINTATFSRGMFRDERVSFFRLFDFSAKWDIIPTMLTQDHETVIREFYGQTTAFNKFLIKPGVLILGQSREENKVRYIYNTYGKGFWTFYSGHDPEGFPGPGRISNLELYPHSPGYRLILNNILFPSAKKKKQKT